MKLASLKAGGRDGTLVVVSENLKKAVAIPGVAPTMQQALERWDAVSPHLKKIYNSLNAGEPLKGIFDFDQKKVASPLPRAYQWLDGSAYVNHVELVRKSRGVEMPESFWTDPLMYQGESDWLLGPHDDIPVADEKFGIDFEAEIAVVVDDVPMGVTPEDATKHIKLIMLVNDVSLRYLAMPELTKGFGFLQAKPATAFSPVAVTPDALGDTWKDGKVCLPLLSEYNGKFYGKPNAGVDMVFNFPKLVSHAARTRFLSAGTIIGSGTVSNKDKSVGSSCIVEKRTIEKLETGDSTTPFMKYGDTVKIEMKDAKGVSIFGTIEQKVVPYVYKAAKKERMKLYTFHASSGAYRVRIALNLKGLTAEMAFVDLTKAQQHDPAYAKVNPQTLVPSFITDDGQVLTQSLAIIEYLDETHPNPPLLPKAPLNRARVRAIAHAMASDIAPINNLKIRKYVKDILARDEKEWIQHWTKSGLPGVEKMISATAGKYCFGDTPTLADCVLVPQLFHARRFGCDLSAYPMLVKIDAALNELPAFQAAHPSTHPTLLRL